MRNGEVSLGSYIALSVTPVLKAAIDFFSKKKHKKNNNKKNPTT